MAEIITTKRDTEIGRLLERIIRDHRKDISAYSKGHLNENNLYKPTGCGRVSWETAKLPAISLKNPIKVEPPHSREKMWDAVACFSAGTHRNAGTSFKTDLPEKPTVLNEVDADKDTVLMEEFDASYLILPKGGAYQILPSLYGCITKKDELRERNRLNKHVIETHNLTERGWYDGSRATKHITHCQKQHTTPLLGYSRQWENVAKSCTIYNPLLSDIHTFYRGYLASLQEEGGGIGPDVPSGSSVEVTEKKGIISSLSDCITTMEQSAISLMADNTTLKEERDLTELILSEVQVGPTESVSDNTSTSSVNSYTIASSIEGLRREILHKRADIQELHKHQRQVMVPMEVYQCMIQCVQSAEVELQKQNKNIEAFEKKAAKYEGRLTGLLQNFKKEETAQLLTCLRDN